MRLLPFGAGTLPHATAPEACAYVERFFPEFPFMPQDLEAGALELWKGRTFPRMKTQFWGPTSGEVKDLAAHCELLDAMARDIEPLAPDRWFVLDEPVFQSIGTPFFPGSPELALEAVNAVIASTSARVTWGLHVCGNTDFSILSRLDIGLFHFDAFMAWEALRLYRDDLRSFIASGGVVALGAVPVSAEPGEGERAAAIVHDAVGVLGDLGQRELPVGPACGMRAVTVERAVEIGGLIRRVIASNGPGV